MALDPPLLSHLRQICGGDGVLTAPDEVLVYESDAYPLIRSVPSAVLLPTSTSAVAAAMRALYDAGIGVVPRGSGTSLAGGCHVPAGAVCLTTARMRRLLDVDPIDRTARVEAGMITQQVSDAVAPHGLAYAPDPSSQSTCTIGGNVANNAGGPHTLKHGVTAAHVLGLTAVLADGTVVELGGPQRWRPGIDATRAWIGSEGTFGVITEVLVALIPTVPARRTILAVFQSMDAASGVVGEIIAAGILPAALEMMDRAILQLVEAAYHFGFPSDADAVLLIELDGVEAGLDRQMDRVVALARGAGATRIEQARTAVEQAQLWTARKTAFGTLGRAAPTCITQDGVVPRSQLPHILRFVRDVAAAHGLRVASNFHAGDGNIHPNLLFDGRDPAQVRRAHRASDQILAECLRVGGSISGEHGIGIEKVAALKKMFTPADLQAQWRIRQVFDPERRLNPDKVFDAVPPAHSVDEPRRPLSGSLEATLIRLAEALPGAQQAVWLPRTIDELAAVLRACHDHDTAVVILGHGTTAPHASTPSAPHAVWISTRHLSAVRDYPVDDMSITVESGCPLRAVLDRVAAHGHHLGAAPRHAVRGSVGGWIATAPAMPQTAAYHGIAHAVLEARFLLADGTLVRAGARTPKNVAGYDLHHLLVGSSGAMAVPVEVTLRLRPRPELQRAVLFTLRDAEDLQDRWTAWRTGTTRPRWSVALGPTAARRRGLPPCWHAVVVVEDDAEAAEWQASELVRRVGGTVLDDRGLMATLEQWPGVAPIEWTTRPSRVPSAMDALEHAGCAAIGHLDSGAILADSPAIAPAIGAVRPHIVAGDTLRAWPSPGTMQWVQEPADAAWGRRLRSALDPRAILRPAIDTREPSR